tara:strand:+ start:1831 stop:2058 length:228 start_codon:yes stop_codon:yes gene_type:complete
MNKLILISILLLSACSPTYETGTLVWVGCYAVQQNPSPEGSTAYSMLRKSFNGERIYLQQISKDGRSDVTVGNKC